MRASSTRATLRLTQAHFALDRAYLEGLDEATLHAHYGVPGTDARVTRRTLATLHDTLMSGALRARHRRDARDSQPRLRKIGR